MQNPSRHRLKFAFIFALFLFVGGALSHYNALAKEEKLPLNKLLELTEVIQKVKENYVEEISTEELLDNAIRGVLDGLDPHSVYLSAAQLKSFESRLEGEEYGGVGIYIGEKNGWVGVVAPIADTPAARAGLLAGDIILKINGDSTQGMAIDDAVDKMRGVVGNVVTLEVITSGAKQSRRVELAREKIVSPSVRASLAEKDFAYIQITQFQKSTVDGLIKNLNALYEENERPLGGIILDLRNNPGGILSASIGVGSVFLRPGKTVVSEKNRNGAKDFVVQKSFYRDLKNVPEIKKVPMVVLVNNGSASASEIVAGALKDHRRAVIIGQRTYGKGSVQSILPLPKSDGAIKLTMSRYYTPSGEFIQARGVDPDIEVRPATTVVEGQNNFLLRESDLAGHLKNDSQAKTAPTKNGETAPFIPVDDYQYEQALVIVKSLAVTAAAIS